MFKNLSNAANAGGQNKPNSDESFSGTVDPTGLERAAKAAREIDSSPNARMALELVREQERTKQTEHEAKTSELRAYEAQQRAKNIEIQAEQQRKTLEKQAEYARGQELYRDKLERERQKDGIAMQAQTQRALKEEERKKDEESVMKQEAIRRKTIEYETALRQQADVAKAKAESEGRINQERKNHDLIMQQKRLELRESRKTTLESIRVATTSIGSGLSSFVSDKNKVYNAVFGLSAAALGIYFARTSTHVIGNYISARLGKPSLVRDTSRVTLFSALKQPILTSQLVYKRLASNNANQLNNIESLNHIVLPDTTKQRLFRISNATKNAKVNRAPFRNILLTGPPGTGKTLFAKSLAEKSGLEYAIFTGGDLAPLGSSAVTELHKLFDWANTTRKGLLLFIDEADAFLRTRSSAVGATEDMRNALNAFLYRTGQPSDRFMIMLATNRPYEFDEAASDRVDDVIPFELPGEKERLEMVQLYVKKSLINAKVPITLEKGVEWDKIWDNVVSITDGFSGREIEKLVIGWQASAYASKHVRLSESEVKLVVEEHVKQKKMKEKWAQSQQNISNPNFPNFQVVGMDGSKIPSSSSNQNSSTDQANADGMRMYTSAQ